MGKFALSKLISYLLIIFVVLVITIMFLSQMGLVKNPLETWINSMKEELDDQQSQNDPADSALIASRTGAVKIYTELDIPNTGICRIDYKLPTLLGKSKTDGYEYKINNVDNKLFFKYGDNLEGMSFVKETKNIKQVILLQDIQNAFDFATVEEVLKAVNDYSEAKVMALVQTNKLTFRDQFELMHENGENLLIYEDGEIEFDLKGVENPYMANLWRTAFRVDDKLVFVDGTINDVTKAGWKESEKTDEINQINICGG